MLSGNHQVIHTLCQWLNQATPAWLATILKTYGSSPRPAGSLMAYSCKRDLVGSISGGCIEEELLNGLADGEANQQPTIIRYGISQEEQIKFMLPCGGQLKVLIEPISPDRHREHFCQLNKALHRGELIARTINLNNGDMEIAQPHSSPGQIPQAASNQVQHILGPQLKLILIGAGQVSQILAQMASTLDYEIFVCDPRPQYAQNWPTSALPNVVFSHQLPDDFLRATNIHGATAIVTLSHDPRVDDLALMEALHSEAFYIGAMGSLASSEKRLQRLRELDIEADRLEKLTAPVGVAIGSKTPAEIAISILADLTKQKSRLPLNYLPIQDGSQ